MLLEQEVKGLLSLLGKVRILVLISVVFDAVLVDESYICVELCAWMDVCDDNLVVPP